MITKNIQTCRCDNCNKEVDFQVGHKHKSDITKWHNIQNLIFTSENATHTITNRDFCTQSCLLEFIADKIKMKEEEYKKFLKTRTVNI